MCALVYLVPYNIYKHVKRQKLQVSSAKLSP